LDALVTREMAVGELVERVQLAQPLVSKHLRILSNAGLVDCRPDGRRRVYLLRSDRLRPLKSWMDKFEPFLSERLDRLEEHLALNVDGRETS
jgi:DNA-binding transcriptional ArsR family regulator